MGENSAQDAILASSHGTEQFMTYLSALRKVENLVRVGEEIPCTSAVDVQENGAIGPAAHEESGEVPRDVPQDCSPESILHFVSSNKFSDLKFRPKLRARGRPKRPQRHLCSFNKTSVDRESVSRRGRKRKNEPKPNSSKRRRLSPTNDIDSNYCPICSKPISSGDRGVTTMDCRLQLIYESCLDEIDGCENCDS